MEGWHYEFAALAHAVMSQKLPIRAQTLPPARPHRALLRDRTRARSPGESDHCLGGIRLVLITGATGVLGKAIVKSAVDARLPVRQGVRNPVKASSTAEAVRLDYADRSAISPALEEAAELVLMAPPLDANAPSLLGPVVTAAKAAGVGQIVLISAIGVNHGEQAPMRIVEHLVCRLRRALYNPASELLHGEFRGGLSGGGHWRTERNLAGGGKWQNEFHLSQRHRRGRSGRLAAVADRDRN